MEKSNHDDASPTRHPPGELARLICKLRWVGLDDEARRLQQAARTVAVEERGIVSAGPFSTD
jgi:hypothetical protein